MGILDYLQRILNQLGNLINSDIQILTTLVTSGWSAVIFEGAKVTVDVHSLLTDPECGQEAQCAKLTTVLGDLATLSMQLAALGAPQQTGSPVTLPTVPPAGYGGPSVGDIAAQVWHWVPVDAGRFPASEDVIAKLDGFLDAFDGYYDLPTQGGGPFRAQGNFNPRANFPFATNPNVNPTSIIPSDTDIGAWLNRMGPLTWSFDSGSYYWFAHEPFTNGGWYYCTLSNAEFLWLRENNAALVKPAIAPVWPGLADVTFDVPTAFADVPFTVVGPMDGVVISITSVPQPNAQYGFNGTVSYRYLGSITFEDDNGDCEFAQSLGFQDAIYVPAHMNHASFCRIRPNKSGIVGTVTPWTKN